MKPPMRKNLMPWIPAIYCGCLCFITLIAGIVGEWLTGASDTGMIAFLCFLPICFIHVGGILQELRNENHELRNKIDKLSGVDKL